MATIQKIKIAQRDLNIEDGDYRTLLHRVTGKTSATQLTIDERKAVMREMHRLGFKTKPATGKRSKLQGKYAAKLQALWIAGWNLGLIRNRDDSAMLAFVKRQTKIDHTRFLHHQSDAEKAIEALKRWLARDGGVKWGRKSKREPHYNDREQIAHAQWKILSMAGKQPDQTPLAYWEKIAPPVRNWSDQDWINIMNAQGEIVREVKDAEQCAEA